MNLSPKLLRVPALSLLRRLGALTLRQRFLVSPLLGLVLIIVLTLLQVAESRRQDVLLEHFASHQLKALDRLTSLVAVLAREHLALFELLHDAQERYGEEDIYVMAQGRLDQIRRVIASLQAAIMVAPPQPGGLPSSNDSEQFRELLAMVQSYQKSVNTAVELATVNPALARRELIKANTSFLAMNNAFVSFLEKERAADNAIIQAEVRRSWLSSVVLAAAGLFLAILLLLLSQLLYRVLARSLESQLNALANLGRKAGADVDAADDNDTVASLSKAITVFHEALTKIKKNEGELAALNGRLQSAQAELEQRVSARTGELHRANQELLVLNASLSRRSMELEESEASARQILELTPEAMWVHVDGKFVFMNGAAIKLFGAASGQALLGSSVLDRVPDEYHHQMSLRILNAPEGKGDVSPLHLDMLKVDGSRIPVLVIGTAIRLKSSICMLVVAHDMSERLLHEAELAHQATHDGLTGLPNRVLLSERLAHAISLSERSPVRFAVMFIDLDKFKNINDSLGHDVGDKLLCVIAKRLKDCTRESDTVVRFGGDEFVLLLDPITDEKLPSFLAQRIVQVLAQPVVLAGQPHSLTCSIGISVYPEDGSDAEGLLKHADIAMYRAKETGRNRYQFFLHDMQVSLDNNLALEKQLRLALERNEFILHYQPKIALHSGQVIGAEALIRWQSPELGLVHPAHFIPLAEESTLICEIGEWVLNAACGQIKCWQASGLRIVPVAINVAALQFSHQRIDLLMQHVLQSHQVDAKYLEIELTESMSMADPEASIEIMKRLKDIGVSLSIDDFGTGYSNLSYLKRFPVDKLKIDRSFVMELTGDAQSRSIAKAVIQLAHSLGLKAVAEGVETEEQLNALLEEGCDEMQGYHFSAPLPEPEFAALLRQQPRLDQAVVPALDNVMREE